MTVEDFPAFYSAIHGYPPFDWQEQLMKWVADERLAHYDCAAHQFGEDVRNRYRGISSGFTGWPHDGGNESAALRTFFVIDRRVVVDEASEHSQKIAKALKNAQDGIVAEVAGATVDVRRRVTARSEYDARRHVPRQFMGGRAESTADLRFDR